MSGPCYSTNSTNGLTMSGCYSTNGLTMSGVLGHARRAAWYRLHRRGGATP